MTSSAFSFFLYGFLHKSLQLQLEKGEEYRNAMAAMEVDGTARAAADGDDLPGASASGMVHAYMGQKLLKSNTSLNFQ